MKPFLFFKLQAISLQCYKENTSVDIFQGLHQDFKTVFSERLLIATLEYSRVQPC